MAYEVTATRKRPQRFEELVGQDFVVATLTNSIQSGKTAHAYLFSGPRGCGKTSAARILAKVLNCRSETKDVPCGICSACTEIAKGSCMDVIEIDGASNTSVNDVRQIKDEVLFPPNSLKYKIYIIDEVHMLSTSAFNALLKTIEEPPPYVIFVFATTELHKVPATIKSRCQQFHFRLGSPDQIKKLLEKAAQEAGITADDEALYWIARESTGSFRDAYTLFDQVAAFSEGSITYEKIRDKLGVVGVEQLNDLCCLCAAGSTGEALLFIDTLLQSGLSVEQCISNIGDYLRSLLFIKAGVKKEELLAQAPERYAAQVLQSWSCPQLEKALSLFLQLYRDVRYSLNSRYELELAVEKLCSLSSWISGEDVKKAVDKAAYLLTDSCYKTAHVSVPEKDCANNIPTPALCSVAPVFTGQSEVPVKTTVSAGQKAIVGSNLPVCSGSSEKNPVGVADVCCEQGHKARSVEDLKEKAIALLSKSKPALSAALLRTQMWTLNGQTVHISVQTAFEQNQLQSELSLLGRTLSDLWSEKLQCGIELVLPPEDQRLADEIPDQVQMVCDVFQGKIEKIEVKQPDKKEADLRGDNSEDESL